MDMYTRIAEHYDLLFPLDAQVVSFLEQEMAFLEIPFDRYLDIGCATGALLSAFSGKFRHLYGLDLDPALLSLAAKKLFPVDTGKTELLEASMADLDTLFPEEEFSVITCMGNTLPHLELPEFGPFLESVSRHLEGGGVFIFQIINYDRILDNALRGLPTLERGEVTFNRYYSLLKPNGRIDFDTILTDPEEELEIENSVELTPVRKRQLEEYLYSAGFTRARFFGSFSGELWTPESFLTIGVCS